jgi:hypothetical protein
MLIKSPVLSSGKFSQVAELVDATTERVSNRYTLILFTGSNPVLTTRLSDPTCLQMGCELLVGSLILLILFQIGI